MKDTQIINEIRQPTTKLKRRSAKRRLAIGVLVVTSSVAFGTAGYSLTNGGASSPDTNEFLHVNWVVPHGNVNTHRGAVIPLEVGFQAQPFPGVWFGYEDASGQHYSFALDFHHDDGVSPQGYSLKVPSNLPNGTYKLQSITMTGASSAGSHTGEAEVMFLSRSQEYVAMPTGTNTPVNGNEPRDRKYNVDFTKLDLKVS